ncbi:MAG TPA: hypothetical protein VMO81_10695 [Aestuariivirgaceae bacterium]|nr:hypothetical protein [Aestuariivirgaceae bacterium]
MTAPKLVGTVSSLLTSILIASGPAFAYHGEANHGVVPWGAILPIVAVVVVGVILLSVWKPQSRNAKARKRDRSPGQRAAHKKQKRAR